MERRRLGKTGHESSVVAFGTYAIGNVGQDEADRAIEEALARGVNHFDVAPTYADAEVRLGSYLKRHPQPDLFIGCKTNERGRAAAREELDRTLERLGRDRFDLYQLHAVGTRAELDACFSPGGSMEAILEARDEGIVDHIGITGHGLAAPVTHAEALRRFSFSTVMVAVNPLLHAMPDFRRDWENLVARCQANDVGIHVLKATAKAPWPDRSRATLNTWYIPFTEQADIDRAVAWALNQPVTTLCSSGELSVLSKILDAAERYREVDPAAQASLLTSTPDYGNIFVGADA